MNITTKQLRFSKYSKFDKIMSIIERVLNLAKRKKKKRKISMLLRSMTLYFPILRCKDIFD